MKPTLETSSVLLSIVLLASGCHREPAKSADKPSIRRVVVDTPKLKDLARICEQPGRIEAYEETPIYSRVSGYVRAVLVDIGDTVKKGQPLLELDVPDLVEQVNQKEALKQECVASAAQAKAAITSAQAMVETARSLLVESQAALQKTEAEIERSNSDLERTRELASTSAVSPKIVAEAQSVYSSALASKEEAAAKIKSQAAHLREAEAKVEQSKADHDAAMARIDTIEAELAETRSMLAYATLRAPFDGVITERHVHTGYLVEPGRTEAKPLLVVSRTDIVRVQVDVPEIDAALVDVGDKALLRIQAKGGKPLETKVTRISWSLHPTSRTLRAEIDVPNGDGSLRPGMYAFSVITLEETPQTLTVPTSAVRVIGAETFCFVLGDGVIRQKKVELGLRSGKEWAVKSGIVAEDKVIQSGVEALQDGEAAQGLPPAPKT